MLVIEFWVITLWVSSSFAIISLLLNRNAGRGAIEERRLVRNLGLRKE